MNEVKNEEYGSCVTKLDNHLIHGSKSLQEEMKLFVRPSGKSVTLWENVKYHNTLRIVGLFHMIFLSIVFENYLNYIAFERGIIHVRI